MIDAETLIEMMNSTSKTVPQNFGLLRNADGHAKILGPCGDTMEFWIMIEDSIIEDASFTTDGCQASIRSGSAVAQMILGLPEKDAYNLNKNNVIKNLPESSITSEHCIILALNTLRMAIDNYRALWEKESNILM